MKKFLVILIVLATVNSFGATQAASKKKSKKSQATTTTTTTTTTTAPLATTVGAPDAVTVSAPTATSTATVATQKTPGAVTGTLDIRPSYGNKTGEMHTENYVDLGYKFNDKYHLVFEQDFNTGLNNSPTSFSDGDFTLQHAFFRGKVANIWQSSDKVYSLSYEIRPYLPTLKTARDSGMVTVVRNYAKFAAKISNAVTLSAYEIPIVHFYDRAGNGSKANSVFENRVYLIADWTITDKLSLNANLFLSAAKKREFTGAANSGAWAYELWTNPELDYAIDANYAIGVSYYSDNFIKPDFSGFTIGDGLEQGVTQLVFRATL